MKTGSYKSRLRNTRRNLASGIIKQILVIGLNFVARTAVIYLLGAEYEGLSGLFTSILHTLNLTDLGFAAAVTFILYQPIADNDENKINAIIAFLRKVYRIVGLVILLIGLSLLPVLTHLIAGSYPNDINIYMLYCIYLLNSSASYFLFAYKSTLLSAMQRDDLVSNAYSYTTIATKALQVFVLLAFKSFYLYAGAQLIGTIFNNLLVKRFSTIAFPSVSPVGTIDQATKDELWRQVKAIFVCRLSDIARNSLDNVVISSFFGLTAVAAYGNYYYIYSAVYGFMGIIIHSVWASVGNSLAQDSVDKNYQDSIKLAFIFMWIAGWCAIAMCCLYQPFMAIWMSGKPDLVLPFQDMLLFCLYFYIISMVYTKNVYLETRGLFPESRKWYIMEAVGNLMLNIALGYLLGIAGVLLATIITLLVFNFAGGTAVLYRHYFKRSPKEYLAYMLLFFGVSAANCVVTFFVCELLAPGGALGIVIRLLTCLLTTNGIYLVAYYRTKMFHESWMTVKRMFSRRLA